MALAGSAYDSFMTIATRVSLAQFLATPATEEQRLELIDGEVYQKPMPTFDHGDLQIEAAGLGDDSAVLPNVVFFRSESPREHGHVTIPPHVAVEILSPGQSRLEMSAKARIYLGFGVESVWLVDPARRTIEVFESGERRTLSAEDLLESRSVPGLSGAAGLMFETLDR